jgi:hypothetical protein
MRRREQNGHIFKAFGTFHIRYWVAYNDLPADEKEKIARKRELKGKPLPTRVKKSERLCDGGESVRGSARSRKATHGPGQRSHTR